MHSAVYPEGCAHVLVAPHHYVYAVESRLHAWSNLRGQRVNRVLQDLHDRESVRRYLYRGLEDVLGRAWMCVRRSGTSGVLHRVGWWADASRRGSNMGWEEFRFKLGLMCLLVAAMFVDLNALALLGAERIRHYAALQVPVW